MEATKLLYMEDMQVLRCVAFVEDIEQKDGKTILYLDQTVFYPQGGGQLYDTGVISSGGVRFVVEEVRYTEGRVQHIGHFESGRLMQGEEVECIVDKERRDLHTRLHSAGHVLDMAVSALGYDWIPSKGYHFPDGPYVEYQGNIGDENIDDIVSKLTTKIGDFIDSPIRTEVKFVTREELGKLCRHVPEYLPEGKPIRAVMYGDFGVPCGGTHVTQLSDIGSETVRKMKVKGDTIRISYEIE